MENTKDNCLTDRKWDFRSNSLISKELLAKNSDEQLTDEAFFLKFFQFAKNMMIQFMC